MIKDVEVQMADGSYESIGVVRCGNHYLFDPVDPTEPMRYKGVMIEEDVHGGRVELSAEMRRELDEEELDMVRASGTAGGAESGTVTRELEASAADRETAYRDIREQIDEFRAFGYR